MTAGVAKASAAAVARAIVKTRLAALDGHALGEIQDWRDRDEAIVAELRVALRDGRPAPAAASTASGAYAAHAVAAGVYEAAAGASPATTLDRMIGVLDAMHDRNPAWTAQRALRVA